MALTSSYYTNPNSTFMHSSLPLTLISHPLLLLTITTTAVIITIIVMTANQKVTRQREQERKATETRKIKKAKGKRMANRTLQTKSRPN